jgi:hypothetical protein
LFVLCTSRWHFVWAGLQKEEDKTSIEMGAEALKVAALLHHPQASPEQDQGGQGQKLVLLC